MHLVTSEQMKQIDGRMTKQVGVSVVALMELAGAAVAREAYRIALEVGTARTQGRSRTPVIHVVAGKGNNGADGLAAARHLLAKGCVVCVWLVLPDELSALCREQLQSYVALGGRCANVEDRLEDADVVIDAILGTGSRWPLPAWISPWLRVMADCQKPIVAIDLPTGLHADSGQVDKEAVRAVVTVACGFAKIGHFQLPGREYCGQVTVESLGIPDEMAVASQTECSLLTQKSVSLLVQKRAADSHKGTFGRVGVIAGSTGMYGAAQLTVTAAYRAGAGLVCYLAPSDFAEAAALSFPIECIVRQVPAQGTVTRNDIKAYAKALQDVACGVCGPGLGNLWLQGASIDGEYLDALAEVDVPLVLDAGFLHALSLIPDRGAHFFSKRRAATVITPHPKEFSRLFGVSVEDVQADRVSFADRCARLHHVYVVLKGAGSVLATPTGKQYINPTGNSGLATGGTGDVLAGMIAGMIACGYGAEEAMILAVYVHGLAADLLCEQAQSEESLIASDLLNAVGQAFHRLRKV